MGQENNNSVDLLLANQERIIGQNSELIYANVFHDTIKGSEWLPQDFAFSPGRGALGYPALYVLYRILNEFHPKNILETGMGQSTKMIGMYNHYHKECFHRVVEHDPDWISFFCNHFKLPDTTEVVQLPIIDRNIEVGEVSSNVTMYVGFSEKLAGQVFDFICIDGPYGFRSPDYSRIDIMGILPECLDKSFVILLDDCDRRGEINTLRMISDTLSEHSIEHRVSLYKGEKHTGIVVSPDLSFMCTL